MESAIIAATVVLAGLVSGNLTEIVKRIIKTDKNLKAFYDFIYSFINGEKWYNK